MQTVTFWIALTSGGHDVDTTTGRTKDELLAKLRERYGDDVDSPNFFTISESGIDPPFEVKFEYSDAYDLCEQVRKAVTFDEWPTA